MRRGGARGLVLPAPSTTLASFPSARRQEHLSAWRALRHDLKRARDVKRESRRFPLKSETLRTGPEKRQKETAGKPWRARLSGGRPGRHLVDRADDDKPRLCSICLFQILNCLAVSLESQPGEGTFTGHSGVGDAPEGLAAVHVGQVDLHRGEGHRLQSV